MPVSTPSVFLSSYLLFKAYHSIFLQDQDVRIIGTPLPSSIAPFFRPTIPFQHLLHFSLTPPPIYPLRFHPTTKSHTGNTAVLPLRTRTRGPAYQLPPLTDTSTLDVDPENESYDPLDEVLSLFRANTFFRNFEIKGPADRLLIYGILFVSECLGKLKSGMEKREAEKVGVLVV